MTTSQHNTNSYLSNSSKEKPIIEEETMTPSSIFFTIANYYNIPDTLKNPIVVKGIYLKNSSNSGYDSLKDVINDAYLRLAIPESIRVNLHSNVIYSFKGVLGGRMWKGAMYFTFSITDYTEHLEEDVSRLEQINRLLELKSSYSSTLCPSDVIRKNLMEGRITRLLCIYPLGNYTRNEFIDQFSEFNNVYSVTEARVNFADSSVFSAKIKELDLQGYDVIVVVRGGVTEYDMFNNLDLAETFITLKTPVLLAVGHKDTNVILRSFVPEWKENPTAGGLFLKDLAKDWSEKLELQKVNDTLKTSIKEKESIIKNKDSIIGTRDDTIKVINRSMQEKEGEIKQQKNRIDELEKSLKDKTDIVPLSPLQQKMIKTFPFLFLLFIILLLLLCYELFN